MRIGIIGLGSIGRRHAKHLLNSGHEVFALRTKKGSLKELPHDLSKITETTELETFLDFNLEGIIISSPTSNHIKDFFKISSLNCPVLIEKPLAGDSNSLHEISLGVRKNIRVAYCLRFHPLVKKVQEILLEKELGRILKMSLEVGQYLPSWHPYTDYRTEYFSKKEMGGGALRTLSHELDLALFFAGKFLSVFGFVDHLSPLEINVDDNAYVLAKHTNGIRTNLSIDFLSPTPKRKGNIVGEKGELYYSLFENKLNLALYNGKDARLEVSEADMYESQILAFVDLCEGKDVPELATFDESLQLAKIIEACELSSRNGKLITI